MQGMQLEPRLVENVATRDYVQRTLSERAHDHKPNNGQIKAIGPPIISIGIVAGHKNNNRGYFLVIQTSSTPFSINSVMSC